MSKRSLAGAVLLWAMSAGIGHAGVIDATAATIKAKWAAAQPGDTLRLTGRFGAVNLGGKVGRPPITIDARAATFTDSMTIFNTSGLRFYGGTFDTRGGRARLGKSMVVSGGNDLVFDGQTMVGPATNAGQGMEINKSTGVTVTNGTFRHVQIGISAVSSTGVVLRNNQVVGAQTDGFRVVGSRSVQVLNNSCSGGAPAPGAHPDCVQLWSLSGTPRQSDIAIRDNIATGPTQGFTSFTPEKGGGERLTFSGNIVNSTMPQGIACYGCFDSVFTGNFLTTRPGATSVVTLNIIGGGNNVVADNFRAPLTNKVVLPVLYAEAYQALTGRVYANPYAMVGDIDFDGVGGLSLTRANPATEGTGGLRDTRGILSAGAAAAVEMVPEPDVWALFIIGFGAVGSALRRQRPVRAAALDRA